MADVRILLADRWRPLCEAWSQAFASCKNVMVIEGDYFAQEADAMVSPAHSFGIMDGSLDGAIGDVLGGRVQDVIQTMILERHHGELPVGVCEIVSTGNSRWPYLAVAPTMRVPESVAHTLNTYLAFRAVLLAVRSHNQAGLTAPIGSLAVPGLGTGIGGMEAGRCAVQMRVAFGHVSMPAHIPSFATIHAVHSKLHQ